MNCNKCSAKMELENFEEIEFDGCGNCGAQFLTKAHLHFKCNNCQNIKIQKKKFQNDDSLYLSCC